MRNRSARLWLIVIVAIVVTACASAQPRRAYRQSTRLPSSARPQRAYAAGRFALILDGAPAGFLPSVSGGSTRAEPATHQLGPTNVQRKNIATVKYEPLTLEVGMGVSKGFYEWIKHSFNHESMRKNGAIHAMDFDGASKSVREFHDAYIQDVMIPALDGSSKEPAYMTVKIVPAAIESRPGTGRPAPGASQPAAGHKQWLSSNFRVTIADLPCERVSKVDAFTWKMTVVKDQVGSFRAPTLHPAKVEISDLKLTISMADVAPWQDWVQRSVVHGAAGAAEVTGAITFLAPNLKDELARIDLVGLRPLSLQPVRSQPNQEQIARFTVALHCYDISFDCLAR